jgi:peptidoglycan hydrolase-like protein with peptidoglycan-binding domain
MATQIGGSVGLGGKNFRADVQAVQELLNRVKVGQGGPLSPVAVDGMFGPETVGAITRFQKQNFSWGDGRVDPNGQTLARLNACADGAAPGAVGGPPAAFGPPTTPSDPNGVIDGAAPPGSGKAAKTPAGDDSVRVVMIVGTAICNNPNWHGGVYPGLILKPEGFIQVLGDDSLVMLEYLPSHRLVQLSAAMPYYVLGVPAPVPPAPYTKNNPKAAPYYQAGNKSPLSKPIPWNAVEGPCKPPAPYYQVP